MLSKIKSLFTGSKEAPEQTLANQVKASAAKTLVIYGAGDIGKRLLPLLRSQYPEVDIVAVVDRRAKYSAFKLAGVEVLPAESIATIDCDAIVIASVAFLDEIIPFVRQQTAGKATQIISV